MNKKFIYYFTIVLVVSALPKTIMVITNHFSKKEITVTCPLDKKVCPDDSTVVRILPNCDFAICPSHVDVTTSLQSITATTTNLSTTTKVTSTTSPILTQTAKEPKPSQIVADVPVTKTTKIVSKITAIVTSVVNAIASPFKASPPQSGNPNDASIPASSYITSQAAPSNNAVYKALPPADFAGQKYLVKDNNILSNDNKVIYTIPPEVITAVSSSNAGWTNTTINVVPVGTVAPIPPGNAIPITDLPGKYYLSENSFGNMEACEFSNKIFILDINANTVTLLYEENGTTLSHDDPRACNSEIYLLATEASDLILKYHTIGTNTLCDSAWSEPDKTFFLDVTKLQTEGMKHYTIPDNLSITAEQEEDACRAKL